MRKTIIITAGAAIAFAAGTTIITAAAAQAAPPEIGTHHFYDCVGPAGTPEEFDAVYSLGSARFVVDSTTVWKVWRTVDAATGEVLIFDMPASMLANAQVPRVTCLFEALHSDTLLIATGSLMGAQGSGG